jgi:hypothetical protein
MGFLGFGHNQIKIDYNPYKEESINMIYNLLFCDNENLFKTQNQTENKYPWDIILSNNYKEDDYKKVINDTSIESRTKILAYRKLITNGYKIDTKDLLGVIIEIGLDNGLDVLAAYRDGSARYINQSEKLIIWDKPDSDSKRLLNQLFETSGNVVRKIGSWDKPRLSYPKKGNARITFLVSDGLYFGEASSEVLFNDSLAGPVLYSGAELMKYLMDKVQNGK